MNRRLIMVVAALGVAFASSGCGAVGAPPPGGRVDAEVLSFKSDEFGARGSTAILDSERAVRAYLGGFTVPSVHTAPSFVAKLTEPFITGKSYVALNQPGGCHYAERVELWRDRDNLEARLIGGKNYPECVRAVAPSVLFRVDNKDIDGIKTINGVPVDRDGPAAAVGLTLLGSGSLLPGFAPREITGAAERATLAGEFGAAGVADPPAVMALLDGASVLSSQKYPDPLRRFAFVLPGCAAVAPLMYVSADALRADLGANPNVQCSVPAKYLAVFDIRAADVPQGAEPVR
ncbi:hypothetical protein [Nocardia sp. NPDC052566]|uniref:hypothetical protein n=1 Tax=Nocardia sp. NPDC052566 TaxID=3364330 RepID=UPI0037CAA545